MVGKGLRQMSTYRSRIMRILAMLLCIVLVVCHSSTAPAEKTAATPTDLTEKEKPFEQTETVDGVIITVKAKEGAAASDSTLSVEKADNEHFRQSAEKALEIEPDENVLIHHLILNIAVTGMNGTCKVRMQKLGLTGMQEQYPDSEINVYVLLYHEAETDTREATQRIPAIVRVQQDAIDFVMAEPGMYDVVTVVRRPIKEIPAGEEAPEESTDSKPEQEETTADELPKEQPADESSITEQYAEETAGEKAKTTEPAVPETTIHEPVIGEYQLQEEPISALGQDMETRLAEAMTGETDTVRAFVIRCYWLILGREPDETGLEHWTNKLKGRNATAADIIFGFIASREFTSMRKPSEELIEILYRTMLNRASDESGRTNWSQLIASGASLNKLINGFCSSNEFKDICTNYGIESGVLGEGSTAEPIAYSERIVAFVTRCYREALSREPEPDGLQFWCRLLTQKVKTFYEVASCFVFSDEMNRKKLNDEAFVRVLYRLYLGREAEESGLNHWKGKLKEEMTRAEVSKGFANSREFAAIVAAYDSESGAEPEFNYIIVPDDKGLILNNGATVRTKVSPQLAEADTQLKWLSSDTKIFTVTQDGKVTGCYPGQATLTVYFPDGQVIAQIGVKVKANYRAVLFSESTFAGGVIHRNRGDVRLMKSILSAVTGPDGELYKVYSYDDLTASEVYAKISQLLIEPSRDGDVSMFFFASHGDYRSTSREHAGRLWCRNKATWLELPELAKRLSAAKGKVIVLLESCGPGAAVREAGESSDLTPDREEMTDAPELSELIISAFKAADPGLTVYQTEDSFSTREELPENGQIHDGRDKGEGEQDTPGNLFLTDKFIVMTASAYLQASYTIGSDTYNLFPYWLAKGVGTSGPMPADTECGNGDGKLTVNELFQYVYRHTRYRQTPQVYPRDSDYVLFLRK